MQVVFFLKCGMRAEWEVPKGEEQNFSLQGLVVGIRTNGFFTAPNCYIPADEIACMGIAGGPGLTVRQPQHQAPARPQ